MATNENNLINSVDRALKILDLFSERDTELKLTEIGQQLNLHKSTVHGLLRTLSHHGYISQNPENGKYRLGMKLVERSNIALQAMDIRRVANPYLREIAHELGDTTHLVILEGDEAVYIDKVEGEKSIIHLIDDEVVTNKLFEEIIGLFPKKYFVQVSSYFVVNTLKVFAVKFPEIIIADKMSVISVDEEYKEVIKTINSELGEIVDDE